MDKILVKTAEFGEIYQNDKGEYSLTDKQLYELLEKNGLPNAKEVLKTVNDAKANIALEGYKFLAAKAKETKEDQFISFGTGNNRIDLGFLAEHQVTIPAKQGETPRTETRYGYCTYKEYHKVPDAWKRDGGDLAKLSEEMEKAMTK